MMESTSNWKKYKLLLWKNVIIMRRNKLHTLTEIFIPPLFVCILIGMRNLVDVNVIKDPITYTPLNLDKFEEMYSFSHALALFID